MLPKKTIKKADGLSKNDCELNAAKRFIGDFRREHPHLKVIVVADSLHSNGPLIKDLKTASMRFILNVKPSGHPKLFEFINGVTKTITRTSLSGTSYVYNYVNNVPINDTHHDVTANFVDYIETDSKGNVTHFSWVTDVHITEDNIHRIVEGGRAHWHIENAVFNTLKNQGINLSTILVMATGA